MEVQETAVLHELAVGGLFRRAKKKAYVDDKGRRWSMDEIETQPKHALDAEGNAIPVMDPATGQQIRKPETSLLQFELEYDRLGKPVMEPVYVMDWREPDARAATWVVGIRNPTEFSEKRVPLVAIRLAPQAGAERSPKCPTWLFSIAVQTASRSF